MHHLLQEANYPHLQLCVQLKVLMNNSRGITEVLFGLYRGRVMEKEFYEKVKCTCECLETQWRSTFRTLFVAALLITNSLSPFLWSVGKPGSRFNKATVKVNSYNTDPQLSCNFTRLFIICLFCVSFHLKKNNCRIRSIEYPQLVKRRARDMNAH